MPTEGMIVDEEIVGGTAGPQKRKALGSPRATHPNGASGSAQALGSTAAPAENRSTLGNLPTTLGEGEHERPLMEAMMLGIRDLSLGVQDLMGVVVESWELQRDSPYVEKAMELKDRYFKDCKANRGKGIDLGHMKNYVFLSLYQAHRADQQGTQEERDTMEELIGKKVRNSEGSLDIGNVKSLAPMVSYCQITRTQKKGFLNLTLRGDDGLKVKAILDRALARAGKRQWDSPMSRPIHRDIKNGLDAARKKGSKV